ncbi:MAG: DHH family phosphoesterase [Silvanigrellales bacterium]|jgi:nanoRNase/pAp phosphatase (c-di-AMP/oligoRNAs hydrolase)|nr:DHH family phosphoesterase [Silvanigrellales bacterium]
MQGNALVYHIYSHADADGGIAAALFARHVLDTYGAHGWKVDVHPVNHGPSQNDWSLKDIQWPCAILDFTLHPLLLSERFHARRQNALARLGGDETKVPPCAWIDHHPTGSSYPFLTAENASEILPGVLTLWDVDAISTPGLLRTHHVRLGLPRALIETYEEIIDHAEIIDGALYATAEAAHDFASPTVRLQTLFSSSHPCVDRNSLYRQIVRALIREARLEALFDTDPIYAGLLDYEQRLHARQLTAYARVTRREGNVAIANFVGETANEGLGRFLPYLLFPDVEYAVHVLPKAKGMATVSCGINPWNKPKTGDRAEKHLGNYFAAHFGGGGHAFVAGGKIQEADVAEIDRLIDFIRA